MLSYTYDSSMTELQKKTDPAGNVTQYAYDTNGNLTAAVYDPSGANQTTSYTYDANQRLQQVTLPSGETIAYTYDSGGNRLSKTVTTSGPNPTTTEVKDVYQAGRIAYETDGANTILAAFAYDDAGMPTSVQVGSDPSSAPRYYYVYNWHGDVVALVDSNGNAVSSYSYDVFGNVQSDTDRFSNGWRNPYLYDGAFRDYFDNETGLDWMSVRAYDPTLGRFISRDPLGRKPLMGLATQPYVYANNNALKNFDPSGQIVISADGQSITTVVHNYGALYRMVAARNKAAWHCDSACKASELSAAQGIANKAAADFNTFRNQLAILGAAAAGAAVVTQTFDVASLAEAAADFLTGFLAPVGAALVFLAGLAATLIPWEYQVAAQAGVLALEADTLGAEFGSEGTDANLTYRSVNDDFRNQIAATVAGFTFVQFFAGFVTGVALQGSVIRPTSEQ
jgi:RHS repeat-associated protein